jgi:hypothetical protein
VGRAWSGSQVGSHSLRTPVDNPGREWNQEPLSPGEMDFRGQFWTPRGDLRIRRLGVRVPPGVPQKPLRKRGFRRFERAPIGRDDRCPLLPERRWSNQAREFVVSASSVSHRRSSSGWVHVPGAASRRNRLPGCERVTLVGRALSLAERRMPADRVDVDPVGLRKCQSFP